MANTPVTKIYSLKTTGYSDLKKQLQDIAKLFNDIKTAKQNAERGLATTASVQAAAAYRSELQRIRIEEAELSRQNKQLEADMRVQQLQRQAQIQQIRDATALQNALTAQQTSNSRQARQNAQAEAGSYNELVQRAKEFYALLKNTPKTGTLDFQGQTFSYQEAINEYKRLSAAEQDFRRQFAKDQTLVGEYTTGIVQAFKSLGLDDLINNQVARATQRMETLKAETITLRDALLQIRSGGQAGFDALNNTLQAMVNTTGNVDARFQTLHDIIQRTGTDSGAALQAIEAHLINSTNEAQQLGRQVQVIQTEMRGMGDIGDRIVTGISNGFRNIIGQLAQFAIGFFGVQAVIQGVMSAFDKTVSLDSLHSALKLVSKDSAELAKNEQFLTDVTERLGLEYISTAQAFKGFYTASTTAGISADETRRIFESVAAASAKLKLSQEDTNGVLLALSQIASKGKVASEELRGQIGERLPGALAIASKAMGKTQQEFTKLLESGQVLATDFLPKFAAELQKTFGGDTTAKVEGLQATINRFSNQFTKFLNDNNVAIAGFLTAIIGLLSALTGLVSIMPGLLVLLTLYATGWAIANKAIIVQRAELFFLNVQMIAGRIALGLLTIAEYAFNTALIITNTIVRTVTLTMQLFGLSMGALPIRVIVTLLLALGAALVAMAKSTSDAANNMRKLTAAQLDALKQRKAQMEVENAALVIYQKETVELNKLYSVATNTNLAYDVRKGAIQKLIDQYPAYFGNLNSETATVAQLSEAYKKLSDNILLNARVKASAEISGKKQERANQVAGIIGEIETNFQAGVRKIAVNDDNKDILLKALEDAGIQAEDIDKTGITYFSKDKTRLLDALEKERKARQDIADKYNGIAQGYESQQVAIQKAAEANAKAAIIARINNRDVTGPELDNIIKGLKNDLDLLKLNDPKRKELIARIAEYQNILNDANGKTKEVKASKLSGGERDDLNSLEARLKNEIAQLDLFYAQIKQNRDLTLQEEIDYQTKLRDINDKYSTLKITSIKGNNAAEKAERATLNKDIIDNDIATAERIKEIYKKDFDTRAALLKKGIDTTVAQIKQGLSEFQNDPSVSNTDRANAAADANNLILQETSQYYNNLLALAKEDKQKTEQIEQEKQKSLADIMRQGADDQKAINVATVDDIQQQGQISIDIRKKQFAEIRTEILNNTALTEDQRKAQLEVFQRAEEREIAAIELDVLNKIVAFKKGLFEKGLISEADYKAVLAQQQQKAEDVANLTVDNITKNLDEYDSSIKGFVKTLSTLLGQTDFFNKEIGKSGISLGFVLSQSFDIAKQAMNDYFNAQAERIKEDKDLQTQRLDIELQQRKARSQSAAESAALDEIYQAKKDEITKQAGEKLKKQKKAEVLIALAAEEANIAVQAAANPLNAVSFGTAGLAQFAILSGIAIAKAAFQIAAINSQQFEYGGNVKKGGAGINKGKTHAQGGNKFMFDGEVYEDEVKEIRIIRTKDVNPNQKFSISGTQAQIASSLNVLGGGHSFEPGAMLKRFEYGGGISLQQYGVAPVFSASSSGISRTDMDIMFSGMMAMVQATNERIDKVEVVQDIDTVNAAQKKRVKQKQISTL